MYVLHDIAIVRAQNIADSVKDGQSDNHIHPSFVMVFGVISADLRRSDALIVLSINK